MYRNYVSSEHMYNMYNNDDLFSFLLENLYFWNIQTIFYIYIYLIACQEKSFYLILHHVKSHCDNFSTCLDSFFGQGKNYSFPRPYLSVIRQNERGKFALDENFYQVNFFPENFAYNMVLTISRVKKKYDVLCKSKIKEV